MSVVFHGSAGKMILKGFVAAIVLCFAWINAVAGGTSYSNVYVQSGPGLGFYGPAALRTAPLAPLAAAPLMSSLLPPCVSPCVVPGQQVAALAPVATSSANFVSYKSPISVPVVVAPNKDDGTSYEYSYVVYDEDTGDQKAQKETSDGSVVRGQYSLIQPDGYIREVQYTADDIRGFNAVVKKFLPEAEAKALPPCPEVKNEPLKESNEKLEEAHDLEPEVHGEAHKEEQSHESHGHGDPNEQAGHGHEEHQNHVEHAEPKVHEEHESHEEHEGHKEPENYEQHAEPEGHGGSEERGGHEEHESHEEHAEPEGHNNNDKHESHEEHGEQGKPEGHENDFAHEEHAPKSHEESHNAVEHGSEEKKEEEPRAAQASQGILGDANALVSYNDVIKCIQSAIKGANMPQPSASPLTYIVLNKPC